jgi:hypothetical protein
MRLKAVYLVSILLLMACDANDTNSKPTYGESTGLPKNCRAIVQFNIDAYRAKQFTADEIMSSLERNCGINGYSWEEH